MVYSPYLNKPIKNPESCTYTKGLCYWLLVVFNIQCSFLEIRYTSLLLHHQHRGGEWVFEWNQHYQGKSMYIMQTKESSSIVLLSMLVPVRHIFVQSLQWKHQINMLWMCLKLIIKSPGWRHLVLLSCLYSKFWAHFRQSFGIFIVDLEQINVICLYC